MSRNQLPIKPVSNGLLGQIEELNKIHTCDKCANGMSYIKKSENNGSYQIRDIQQYDTATNRCKLFPFFLQ
jgi:hypothetical protein